jgi:hypothetical protein
VLQAISNAEIHLQAAMAVQAELQLPALLTAMDLSVEVEAFGCQIRFSENETPTVIGRRVQSLAEIQSLPFHLSTRGAQAFTSKRPKNWSPPGRSVNCPSWAALSGLFRWLHTSLASQKRLK